MNSFIKKEIVFYGESKKYRLDSWLAEQLSDFSRTFIQHLIKGGKIIINSSSVKSNYKLINEDRITIEVPPPEPSQPAAQSIPLDIIYEDDDIIAVNKPVGMVVHPAAGISENTLVNALLYHCKNLSGIGGVKRPGIVHRLDKNTSGVMLAAKNDFAHQSLTRQIAARTIQKTYLTFVTGSIPQDELTIDAPIGRNPHNRKSMAVTVGKGRQSITHIKVIVNFGFITYAYTLPHTGRTHQIRVHLSHIKHPVVGDKEYGYSEKAQINRIPQEYKSLRIALLKVKRQLLHSYTLKFTHPRTKKMIELKAAVPDDFKGIIRELKKISDFKFD